MSKTNPTKKTGDALEGSTIGTRHLLLKDMNIIWNEIMLDSSMHK
jgi:hypothetical protein